MKNCPSLALSKAISKKHCSLAGLFFMIILFHNLSLKSIYNLFLRFLYKNLSTHLNKMDF